MANGDKFTPSDEFIEGLESEKTRYCFEFLGWSTSQWDSPLDILLSNEETTIDREEAIISFIEEQTNAKKQR